MFHQVEGLWIDEHISFADLKGVYTDFLRQFFEIDDSRCASARRSPVHRAFGRDRHELKGKWLEISGSGQVHPSVVRNFGLDPEKYIGFAFGSGVERLAMLRYGIEDLRSVLRRRPAVPGAVLVIVPESWLRSFCNPPIAGADRREADDGGSKSKLTKPLERSSAASWWARCFRSRNTPERTS